MELRELVQQCLTGDQLAMSRLVDRFKGQVFGLCYRMLGQRQDAEEAAQETFLRVLRSLHRWDPTREFEPWLLTIAGNRCRTALAARMRRPAVHPLPVDQLPEQRADGQNQMAEEVELALQTVRPEYRQAFLLFHQHECSYAEIAEVLERPIGTVKTWIHRARRELIAALQQREVVHGAGR